MARIKKKRPQWLKSKWRKTQVLLQNKQVGALIPRTRILTRQTLRYMLRDYQMVYLKPDKGTWGKGVMKVRVAKGRYVMSWGERHQVHSNYPSLLRSIRKRTGRTRYLVQKGIHLLKYKGRRFDIRVMVQRNLRGNWETTGIIGRLAHPRKIVTNYHDGGKLMRVDTLLKNHMHISQRKRLKSRLIKLGVIVARKLSSKFHRLKSVGLDVALDHTHKPRILEVNTKPDPKIFRVLPNKNVYRRIRRYARAHRFR